MGDAEVIEIKSDEAEISIKRAMNSAYIICNSTVCFLRYWSLVLFDLNRDQYRNVFLNTSMYICSINHRLIVL